MPALFRSPLLHFLLIGVLLSIAQGWRSPGEESADVGVFRIAIEAGRMEEMQRSFAEQMGRTPADAEIGRMIEAEVEEEILFREAIARGLLERDGGVQTRLIQKMLFLEGGTKIEDAPALLARAVELGLHHEDIVVRRILVQKMRLLGSTLDASQIPTPREIADAYRSGRDELRAPDRLSLGHVFMSSDRRGERMRADALALRDELVAAATPANDAPTRGDPFPLGHRLERRSQNDLDRAFGARFGELAFALELERWSDPIASAYGLHLIRVDTHESGQVPPLESVSDRLRLQIEERRRDANLEALLSDLRTRYEVILPDTGPMPTQMPRLRPLERNQEPG